MSGTVFKNKIVFLLICLAFLGWAINLQEKHDKTVSLHVGSRVMLDNGSRSFLEIPPYLKDGRVYISAGDLCRAVGARSDWDADRGVLVLTRGQDVMVLTPGIARATLNERLISLRGAPELIQGRLMLPLRDLTGVLGYTADWEPIAEAITLRYTGMKSPTFTPVSDRLTFSWVFEGVRYQWGPVKLTADSHQKVLERYRSLPHPHFTKSGLYAQVHRYTDDPYDDQVIAAVVSHLKEIARREGITGTRAARFVISFVQGLEHAPDEVTANSDEYPRYPLETLLDHGGDCEDTSILAAVLLREMGYGAAIIFIPADEPVHAALGILGDHNLPGAYFSYDGKRYYYLESAGAGWPIGQIPPEYSSSSAIVVPL